MSEVAQKMIKVWVAVLSSIQSQISEKLGNMVDWGLTHFSLFVLEIGPEPR